MAKVRDGEVERSSNGDERNDEDDEVEDRGSRVAHSDHRAPAFEVQMTAPWGAQNGLQTAALLGAQSVRCRVPERVSEVTRVVEERSRIHYAWIREDARTRRLALIIGAVLFVAGCQVIVFAPSGRETVAAIVGAAMLVVAAGTAGYRRVWGRSPLISFAAGDAEPMTARLGDLAADVERPKRKQRGSVRR